ncbi:hypothetical protein [Cohnella candidum]|uniref:Uncharacterized protein n=1 Tax=Cohnella candidum TaxID=2674991 RepID=A0A3G3JWA3_9BACL|nr:hypothetical protein [Cohnella candidum]AYQ72137.1 hypothetical protein EAV92_05880 [Cohnella candidum]
MNKDDKQAEQLSARLFTKDGKPLRILSTSLGIALLANVTLMPAGASSAATSSPDASNGPKLVEWSSEAVKQYYDAAVDWNLPLQDDGKGEEQQGTDQGAVSGGRGGSGGTTIVHTSSGFGWDDLILYHLLFNRGTAYSSTTWTNSHPTYYGGTTTRYKPKTHTSGDFQNKSVPGSSVRPKTSDTTGSITRRSTSSSKGGIGGNSSTRSSSSSSSHSFGGFGG